MTLLEATRAKRSGRLVRYTSGYNAGLRCRIHALIAFRGQVFAQVTFPGPQPSHSKPATPPISVLTVPE